LQGKQREFLTDFVMDAAGQPGVLLFDEPLSPGQ
jgi:hypothetical protein